MQAYDDRDKIVTLYDVFACYLISELWCANYEKCYVLCFETKGVLIYFCELPTYFCEFSQFGIESEGVRPSKKYIIICRVIIDIERCGV